MNTEKLEESLRYRGVANMFREGRFIEALNMQRSLEDFENASKEMRQINYIRALPLEVGGNHFHRRKRETIIVLEGDLTVYLEDPVERTKFSTNVAMGKIITLQPNIAHALEAGQRGSSYLEITNMAFDPENPKKDVFDYSIIKSR